MGALHWQRGQITRLDSARKRHNVGRCETFKRSEGAAGRTAPSESCLEF